MVSELHLTSHLILWPIKPVLLRMLPPRSSAVPAVILPKEVLRRNFDFTWQSDVVTLRHPKGFTFCHPKVSSQKVLLRKCSIANTWNHLQETQLSDRQKLRNSSTAKVLSKKLVIFTDEILNVMLLYFHLLLVAHSSERTLVMSETMEKLQKQGFEVFTRTQEVNREIAINALKKTCKKLRAVKIR